MSDPIKAIIVDDEINARENLRYLIENFCPNIQILDEAENVDEAITFIEKHKPQLVFLDIEMPQKNGFELIKHYDSIDFHIVFVTAYDQYAIKAFEVTAVDYLLKPIAIDRLKEAINKVSQQEEQRNLSNRYEALKENTKHKKIKKLSIPYKSDYVIIPVENIIVIEADRMYSSLHISDKTIDKKYVYAKKLRHFEDIFSELSNFMRIHRSWLINTDYIKSYSKKDKEILLQNDMKIPVSKSHKDKLEKLLGF